MKWDYEELIEAIEESYSDLVAQNMSPDQSIGLILEDFYFYPESENLVVNFIAIMNCIKLRIRELEFVYDGEKDLFFKQRSLVTEEVLAVELTSEERKDLESNISYVIDQLKTIEIKFVNT